jgi:hypothetical protein
MDDHQFKDAKDLQSLVSMLAPQYSQSQIREFYLTGLLPDFIGTDMDYWMLIRRYYALKEQTKGGANNCLDIWST